MNKPIVLVTEPTLTSHLGGVPAQVVTKELSGCGMRAFFATPGTLMWNMLLPHAVAVFISIVYVRQFQSVPLVLDACRVSRYSSQRGANDPIVLLGGQAMKAPAPVKRFGDLVFCGDVEAIAPELMICLSRPKKHALELLAQLPGISSQEKPRAKCQFSAPSSHLLSGNKSKNVVEASRGCRKRCVFCVVGWACGPYREASWDKIKDLLKTSCFRCVNLTSADLSGVSWIDIAQQWMRDVGMTNTGKNTSKLSFQPQSGGTYFGLDGVSERLRKAIGKPLSNDRLVELVRKAAEGGCLRLKLYCIVALPGEQTDDWNELFAVVPKLKVGRMRLVFSMTHLHTIPHTPFENLSAVYQNHVADMLAKLKQLCEAHEGKLSVTGAKSPDLHEHDACLLRGGPEMAGYLESIASRKSVPKDWRERMTHHGLSVERLLSADPVNHWEHVDAGASQVAKSKALGRYWESLG